MEERLTHADIPPATQDYKVIKGSPEEVIRQSNERARQASQVNTENGQNNEPKYSPLKATGSINFGGFSTPIRPGERVFGTNDVWVGEER